MPIPTKYLAEFEENHIYHIYNRTNDRELLFLSDENRLFFLRRFAEILSPFVETYCWALLPNHFHFLIRVNATEAITATLLGKEGSELTVTERHFLDEKIVLSQLLEQAFKRFFQSYSQSFNKIHNRSGNLFSKPFKRVHVEKETHFTQAIVYIHANAQKHGVASDFTKYQWSSWQSIVSSLPTRLLRQEVLDWFGGLGAFVDAHKELVEYYYDSEIAVEE